MFGILKKFWIDIGENIFEKIFFQDQNKFLGKIWKYFRCFSDKKSKFRKLKILGISKFWNFENLEIPKILIFQNFDFLSEKTSKFFPRFFWSWKKYFFEKYFHLCQFKFSSGFQKSYLENRAMSLTMQTFHDSLFVYLKHKDNPPNNLLKTSLTWDSQAGSEVMDHFFSRSAWQNMNCSHR